MSESTNETVSESKTEQQKRAYKRKVKNYWLNPQYQMRYIYWTMTTGVILVVLQITAFYNFAHDKFGLLVDLSAMTPDAKQILYGDLHQMLFVLAGMGLFFILLFGVFSLVFSHRTVGPLYQFKRVFDTIKDGKHSERIHLRTQDEFKDVAQSFNDMMDSIK